MNESDKCIHCGKLEADKDHASACPSIIDRHPFEPMATEETKPVEREANPYEQRRRDEEWDRAAALADYNAGRDAALERAAERATEIGMKLFQEKVNAEDIAIIIAAEIRALKGSR